MPRLAVCIAIAIALLGAIFLVSPQQLPVVLYKVSLVTIGVVLGYWLDRALFPYARPHNTFARANEIERMTGGCEESRARRLNGSISMIRRAFIVIACVLGLTLGL